jgi:hypothetical protein
MKKMSLLLYLFSLPLFMFPQELPINFSDPLHQFVPDPVTSPTQFNLIVDPNDASNDLAEIINTEGISDTYDLRLETLVDVTDPNNNTITLDYYNIVDQPHQVLLWLENEYLGGSSIFVSATTSGVAGWETLSFDFDNAQNELAFSGDPVVLSQYGGISITISNINTTSSGVVTCYLDNIQGAQNGATYREFDGDVILSSQQEVNDFGATGYSKVNGSLHIIPQGGNTTTDINDLSALNTIHTIGNEDESSVFEIRGNDNLGSLTGLNTLKRLYANMVFKDNQNLASLSPLSNLEIYNNAFISTGETVIDNNDALVNLDGLHTIIIDVDLTISNNDNLSTIANLTVTSGDVIIENNMSLGTIANVGNFTDDGIFSLTLRDNPNLTSFTNLGIPEIRRELIIDNNDALVDFTGLENIHMGGIFFATGELLVSNNDNLVSLNGLNTDLSDIVNVELDNNRLLSDIALLNNYTQNTLTIKDNDALPSLASLSNYIGGILTIDGNTLLTDLTGLSSYTDAPQLNIYNTNLTSLNRLGNITTIGNSLRIENNHSLTDLSALGTVQSIGFSGAIQTDFNIVNNDMLTSLDGFASLTTIEADIEFTNNALLDDFCGVETAINNGLVRAYFVSSNLYNPTVQDFNDGMCIPLSIDEFDMANISIYPNPTYDVITIDTSRQIREVKVYSIHGREIPCYLKNKRLNVEHLASGVYIIRVISLHGHTYIRNIIKH